MPKTNITNLKTGKSYPMDESQIKKIMANPRTASLYKVDKIKVPDEVKDTINKVVPKPQELKATENKLTVIKGTDKTEKKEKIEKGNVKKATDKGEKLT